MDGLSSLCVYPYLTSLRSVKKCDREGQEPDLLKILDSRFHGDDNREAVGSAGGGNDNDGGIIKRYQDVFKSCKVFRQIKKAPAG